MGFVETAPGIDAAYSAYQKGDGETALRLARSLANQGDVRAQSLLGLIFYDGRGGPRDEFEAMNWFRLAADQGSDTAQLYLGLMYSKGRSVPQNFPEGAMWYRLAANSGNAQAQYNLAVMYFNGEGVSQSNVDAHIWFNLAASRFPISDHGSRYQSARARDAVGKKMTPEEIALAQKLAREWKPQ